MGFSCLHGNSSDLRFKLKQQVFHLLELIILRGQDRVHILSLIIYVLLELLKAA